MRESSHPPRIVGRYAIHDVVASGGMATVHFGRLLGAVGFSRTVAVKCLHAQFASDPEFVSMFLEEARLAARIQHPNVVSTLDVVAIDRELFVIMEYVQGETLAKLMSSSAKLKEPIPLSIVSAIMCAILLGLQAAHEARDERGMPLHVVHRDVSPQNVMVGVDGSSRMLDFGLAKAQNRSLSSDSGRIMGKYAYMAPEQLIGADVTRSADIYAAGVVLWEMLTMGRLYRTDSEAALVEMLLTVPPKPPREVARTRRPDDEVDSAEFVAIDRVAMKALEKRPGDRFTSAREMALAIEQAVTPASSMRVASWLEHHAGPVLKARAQALANVEGTSLVGVSSQSEFAAARASSHPDIQAPPQHDSSRPTDPPPPPPASEQGLNRLTPRSSLTSSRLTPHDSMIAPVSSRSAGAIEIQGTAHDTGGDPIQAIQHPLGVLGDERRPGKVRRWLFAGLVLLCLLFGTTLLVSARQRRGFDVGAAPEASQGRSGISAPLLPGSSGQAPLADPAPSALPSALARGPASASAPRSPASPGRPPGPTPHASVGKPRLPSNCDPPFVWEPDGTKRFRSECM